MRRKEYENPLHIIIFPMVEWKQSGFQIVASLIGSGLVVTAFSTYISDINKPHLHIDLNFGEAKELNPEPDSTTDSDTDSSENNTKHSVMNKIRHIVTNNGKSPATNVILVMSYPGLVILENSTEYRSENISFKKEDCSEPNNLSSCSSLVAHMPRLASGAMVIVNTTVLTNYWGEEERYDARIYRSDFTDFKTPFYNTRPGYSVSVTYDQGSNNYLPYERFSYGGNGNPYDIQLVIIPALLAVVSFTFAARHKKIKLSRYKRDYAKFAYDVLRDIVKTQNVLVKNRYSTKILSFDTWKSKSSEIKREIFNDYNEYRIVDNFYSGIKNRDEEFSNNRITDDTLKKYNDECFKLTNNAYTIIDWKKFRLGDIAGIDYILTIPVIILGSFFITYVCEGVPFFVARYSEPFLFFAFFALIVALRSWAAYFIVNIILKRFQSEAIDNKDFPGGLLSSLGKLTYSKRKLIALSFAIMGVPTGLLGALATQGVSFFLSSLIVEDEPGSMDLLSNLVFQSAINIVIDIVRLYALIYLVPKSFRRIRIGTRKLSYTIKTASILSGLIHLIFAFSLIRISNNSLAVDNPFSIVPIVLILLGAAQIVWVLPIMKHWTKKLNYLGIIGSTFVAMLWMLTLMTLPIILGELGIYDFRYRYDIEESSQSYYDFASNLLSLLPLIYFGTILIILIQLTCAIVLAIIVGRERNTEKNIVKAELVSK